MKKLTRLVGKGWKQVEIKYTRFRVYEKGDERILYDIVSDKMVKKYTETKRR